MDNNANSCFSVLNYTHASVTFLLSGWPTHGNNVWNLGRLRHAFKLKKPEQHLSFLLDDLKTVRSTKNSSLCFYVPSECCTLQLKQIHTKANPPTAHTSYSGPCQLILDNEAEISRFKRAKLLQIQLKHNFLQTFKGVLFVRMQHVHSRIVYLSSCMRAEHVSDPSWCILVRCRLTGDFCWLSRL